MEIKTIKRPWQKQSTYGNRSKRDPFYQSPTWKKTKKSFKQGKTKANNGFMLPNTLCIDCYNESGQLVDMWAVDHVQAIEDGGSRTDHANMRSLCESHHNRKSAIEGNNRKKQNK